MLDLGALQGMLDGLTRRYQSWELGGCDEPDPYTEALKMIDSTIGELKRERRYVQRLREHLHEWGEDDYCLICGADGRA